VIDVCNSTKNWNGAKVNKAILLKGNDNVVDDLWGQLAHINKNYDSEVSFLKKQHRSITERYQKQVDDTVTKIKDRLKELRLDGWEKEADVRIDDDLGAIIIHKHDDSCNHERGVMEFVKNFFHRE
jgi:uncharacterized FlaG/YvyC family protein